VGECLFWYWPTRVVRDQRLLTVVCGCVCCSGEVVVVCCVNVNCAGGEVVVVCCVNVRCAGGEVVVVCVNVSCAGGEVVGGLCECQLCRW